MEDLRKTPYRIPMPDNLHVRFPDSPDSFRSLIERCIASGWRARMMPTKGFSSASAACTWAESCTRSARGVEGGESIEIIPVLRVTSQTDTKTILDAAYNFRIRIFQIDPAMIWDDQERLYDMFLAIQAEKGVAQIRPEDPHTGVSAVNKEASFVENILPNFRSVCPLLKFCLECITTREAVAWVMRESNMQTGASITLKHLMGAADRDALQYAATLPLPFFFRCDADLSTEGALPSLVDLFASMQTPGRRGSMLPLLGQFTSKNWADFHGYFPSTKTLEIPRKPDRQTQTVAS